MKSVTMKWASENVGSINLIDVRSPGEFAERHVEGATNIPMVGLMMNADQFLDKSKTYHLMCRSGGRSANVYMDLEAKGYDVVNCDGGISSI